MTDLARFEELVSLDHGLSVVVTRRADHTPHTTVVNAGVLPHPATGASAVAFVSAGSTRKLAHLRADPAIAVVVRAGWQWTAVEGRAQLIGPDDPHSEVDDERLRLLLREIFRAAGGLTRTGTLMTPSNAQGAPHRGLRLSHSRLLEPDMSADTSESPRSMP